MARKAASVLKRCMKTERLTIACPQQWRRVTCTWWLLGLAVKESWLGLCDMPTLGCETAMVGTGWATSCPDCIDRLTKKHSHLVGG